MIPVIISGGSGTRLWPVSRASYPKQFCEIYDQSFLQNSISRLMPLGEPFVLTVDSMSGLTTRTLSEAGVAPTNMILEPMGKNTAPAVALLCLTMMRRGLGDQIVGVFPADHLVANQPEFMKAVGLAERCAQEDKIVVLGIQPNRPSTGFGYIDVSTDEVMSEVDIVAYKVRGFKEKPNSEKAEEFLNAGHYTWNAGMVVFKVDKMVEHFATHMPDLWSRMKTVNENNSNLKFVYANLKSESLDYGILEKLNELVCIPCDIGWSDVGSWDELSRLSDESGRVSTETKAQIFAVDSSSNYIFSVKQKVIGLIDIHDMIIVDTPDGLLISRKGRSEKVKELVARLQDRGVAEATEHPFEIRPWGGFEVLSTQDANYKVKTIKIDVGARLSYQSHQNRSECWVIVKGAAEVQLNGVISKLDVGDSIKIPNGSKHRITNSGEVPLEFVEVQTGSSFDESDIVRYEDDYGRLES